MKTEDYWYIEWVDYAGTLRWSGFVQEFDAVWDKFIELKQTANEEDWERLERKEGPVGRVRVGAAKDATTGEIEGFDDASGFGPEGYVGLDAAILAARREREMHDTPVLSGDLKDLAEVWIENHGDGALAEARKFAAAARGAGNDAKTALWDQMVEAIAEVQANTPDGR